MNNATSETGLLVLYSADAAEEWSKRDVRAEFLFNHVMLHGVEDDLPPTVVDAASITSITIAVSTLPKGDAIERSFFCTVKAGSNLILEAATNRPMRSTFGWLRDAPTESSQQRSEAYRTLVKQLHIWLARNRSNATFTAKRPILGHPGIAKALYLVLGCGPFILMLGLLFFDGLGHVQRWLDFPRGAAIALWVVALVLSFVGPLFGLIAFGGWLTSGDEHRRPYDPNLLPERLLPPH